MGTGISLQKISALTVAILASLKKYVKKLINKF